MAAQCNPLLCSGALGLPRASLLTGLTHPRAASTSANTGRDGRDTEAEREGELEVADSWMPAWARKENTKAEPGYNRFLNVPGAFAVQIAIGSVYAWSMWNGPLTTSLGVVAPAAGDWVLSDVVPIFSACAVSLGITTFTLGPWVERAGPRASALAAAACYSSGLLLTSVAVDEHMLPLAYLGYGVLGGMGWGFGYTSPVSNMLKWFPDRRGLAAGLSLTAFGGGAMVATPCMSYLTEMYFVAPEFLGSTGDVALITDAGKQFAADTAGVLREVVVATSTDVGALPGDLADGVYVVGTGNTGAADAMRTLGASYLALMTAGAFAQRVPWDGYKPEGYDEQDYSTSSSSSSPSSGAADTGVGSGHPGLTPSGQLRLDSRYAVDADAVLRTPQFYLLWLAVVGNACGGLAVLSSAKTIMGEVFAGAYPAIVTGTFTTAFVAALSAANAGGRLAWAIGSDWLGRKNTYFVFGLAAPFCFAVPYVTGSLGEAAAAGSVAPLYVFSGGTMFVVSCYAGLFSVLPAYLADVFGEKNVGAIHGRMLTAWSAAAVIGPNVLANMRAASYDASLMELAGRCDAATFMATFGTDITNLQQLIDTKTVTIARLMEVRDFDLLVLD